MLTTSNPIHATPNRRWAASLRTAHSLLLIALAGGFLLDVPASAQRDPVAGTQAGTIQGTVVDDTGDPIPGATVALQGPTGNLTGVTKDDGSFAFQNVTPGSAYRIRITSEGFSEWSSSVTVEPGRENNLSEVKLRILTVQPPVTVNYSSKEIAIEQLKAEEQQRVLGFIPNIYVVYEPHAEPLTTKMKFHLAYKSLTNPVFFGRTAAWAVVQQARNNPHEWHHGAEGYGKRLGAGVADATIGGVISNAILPSVLHQDPRYFYQGSGTKKSRVLHAMLAPFVSKGDNGLLQPNYSQLGGSLIGYSISSVFYPSSNRTASHIFEAFGIDIGMHVFGSLAQEFILGKFTSRGKSHEK